MDMQAPARVADRNRIPTRKIVPAAMAPVADDAAILPS
jgi:hypothetical protein